MELWVTILVMVIYAGVITLRAGLAMEEQAAIRPLLAGGGILIIMAGYAWSKHDIQVFFDLVVWFTLAAIPIYLRGAILLLQEQERSKRQQELQELERYRIPEREQEYDNA